MSEPDQTSSDERHKQRMQRKKAVVDEKIAAASIERGIVILLTGNGKGKSSSGFGMVMRALGHGFKAAVVQFIKGAGDEGGERLFLRRHCPEVEFHVQGTGFTWETQNKALDTAAAQAVWQHAKRLLGDDSVRLVLLDEITYVLRYGYVDTDEVIAAIRNRPPLQSVVVTGRGAPPALAEIADTIAELRDERHAFKAGIKAQKGVDF